MAGFIFGFLTVGRGRLCLVVRFAVFAMYGFHRVGKPFKHELKSRRGKSPRHRLEFIPSFIECFVQVQSLRVRRPPRQDR